MSKRDNQNQNNRLIIQRSHQEVRSVRCAIHYCVIMRKWSKLPLFIKIRDGHPSIYTEHLYNICTTLAQRRRRWASVLQMLCKCFVFAVIAHWLERDWLKRNISLESCTRPRGFNHRVGQVFTKISVYPLSTLHDHCLDVVSLGKALHRHVFHFTQV